MKIKSQDRKLPEHFPESSLLECECGMKSNKTSVSPECGLEFSNSPKHGMEFEETSKSPECGLEYADSSKHGAKFRGT